jgi:hypothetical protein
VPAYSGIKFIGYLFMLCGLLCWGIGVPWLISIVVRALSSGDSDVMLLMGGIGLPVGAGLFILGFVQIGMGQLFLCIRDMARNSFHLRRL